MLNLIANDWNNSGQSTKKQRVKNVHTINLKLINLHYLIFFIFITVSIRFNVCMSFLSFHQYIILYTCDQDDDFKGVFFLKMNGFIDDIESSIF